MCGQRQAAQVGESRHAGQGAFQLADIGLHPAGDQLNDRVGHRAAHPFGLRAQDCLAGFQVGRLDIGCQAPLKAGAQALFQGHHRLGRPVGGNDNLFVLAMQGVKGMEKFFLGRFFAGDKLDIVNQQDVDAAIFLSKGLGGVRADRIDQVVGKLFGRNIQHLQAAPGAVVADGVQQVGLSQPDPAVQEERIISLGWFFGHRLRGGMRQPVAGPNHKIIKAVTTA